MSFLLESIYDQNRAVLEVVGDMQQRIKLLATQESLDNLAKEVRVTRLAVTANRQDHLQLERRVDRLEKHTGLA